MPTSVLAAGITATSSSEITVVAGTPKFIGLFRDDEGPIEADCVCPILRKDPNGDFNPTGIVLNGVNPNHNQEGAGVFIVRRPVIKYATGIQTD